MKEFTMTPIVQAILDKYESDNVSTKANLGRILMQGKLGGTGKLVILPVDQGFEHGPARSFAVNPAAYDPHYHYQLAIDAGLSAFAAPLGMIEAGAGTFAGQIPTILKVNSSNSWAQGANQAVTGSVEDAVRLGCAAIGFTIYPGSDDLFDMIGQIREMSAEAKSVGIATVIWSYPRGGMLPKSGELALDVGAYAAHMAALLGAHIIKVKLPSDHIEQKDAKPMYEGTGRSSRTGSNMWCRQALPVGASWCSRGVPPRAQTRSSRMRATFATAAATARSSAATRSSGRAMKRWRCSSGSSPSIKTRSKLHRCSSPIIAASAR
jgi:class I fructose-bisphosphate aldolase